MAAAMVEQAQAGLQDISPTYISSDLLSPDHTTRTTVPSIGVHPVEAKACNKSGQTWGEHYQVYGGIGQKNFLGEPQARDLRVSRSHRHYTSGFSRYKAKVQPYKLTPLTLSSCRINDQLLPPSFQKQLDPKKYVIPLAAPKQSYFSHMCRYEVFPRHDPHRYAYTGEKALTDNTANALQENYTCLYDSPSYATNYPNNTEVIKRNAQKKLDEIHSQWHADMSEAEEIIDDVWEFIHDSDAVGLEAFLSELQTIAKTNKEVAAALAKCALPLQDIMKELRGNRYNKAESVRKLLLPLNILPPLRATILPKPVTMHKDRPQGSHVISEAFHRQHLHNKNYVVKDNDVTPQEPGIYPCWPPGRSYKVDFKKMQLKEVDVLLESNGPEKPPEEVPPEKPDPEAWRRALALIEEASDYHPGYEAYLRDVLPSHLPNVEVTEVGERHPEQSVLVDAYQQAEGHTEYAEPPLAQGELHLPPIPLSACLHPTGNRVQDRLGLSFKTEAHNRFHAMYQDLNPDLRESCYQADWTRVYHPKRYFFLGYHASAFRG